jgi:hypothetical protein
MVIKVKVGIHSLTNGPHDHYDVMPGLGCYHQPRRSIGSDLGYARNLAQDRFIKPRPNFGRVSPSVP